MEFKGTKTEWEVVEHNWRETSICSNGKTICSFELDDIEEEDLTENDLTEEEEEEENAYNIQLIKHSKEMLEMLIYVKEHLNDDDKWSVEQLINQATEL